MARKKRRKLRSIASTRITDDELIARLQDKHPHILDAKVSEANFDATLEKLMMQLPDRDERQHFYCRKCGEYHLKTHPHFAEMTTRRTKAH